nr:hypothetical protein [uncultured Dyadobacter sp.]
MKLAIPSAPKLEITLLPPISESDSPECYAILDIPPYTKYNLVKSSTIEMQPIANEGIYNILVHIDTVRRYFQAYIPMLTPTKNNVFERPSLQISDSQEVLFAALGQLSEIIKSDGANIPKATYILSFNVYNDKPSSQILIFSQYSISGDCQKLRQFISSKIDSLQNTADPLKKLLKSLLKTPSLISETDKFSAMSTENFNKYLENEVCQAFIKNNQSSLTLYFKSL